MSVPQRTVVNIHGKTTVSASRSPVPEERVGVGYTPHATFPKHRHAENATDLRVRSIWRHRMNWQRACAPRLRPIGVCWNCIYQRSEIKDHSLTSVGRSTHRAALAILSLRQPRQGIFKHNNKTIAKDWFTLFSSHLTGSPTLGCWYGRGRWFQSNEVASAWTRSSPVLEIIIHFRNRPVIRPLHAGSNTPFSGNQF